jgi:hypothetical protein
VIVLVWVSRDEHLLDLYKNELQVSAHHAESNSEPC